MATAEPTRSARSLRAPIAARAFALVVGSALAAIILPPRIAAASPWSVPLRPALADPSAEDLAEAQREYQLGTQAYALGNYDQAVAHFERSYALSDRPELLFNIGQSYAQWYTLTGDPGQLRKARKLFQNYVKYLDASHDEDPEARADAQRRIDEIDAELAAVDARNAPPPVVDQPAEPAPQPPPTDKERKPVHRKGWFWGVVIGGVLLVAGGITVGVLATRPPAFEPELGIIGRDLAVPPSAAPSAAPPAAPLLRF